MLNKIVYPEIVSLLVLQSVFGEPATLICAATHLAIDLQGTFCTSANLQYTEQIINIKPSDLQTSHQVT